MKQSKSFKQSHAAREISYKAKLKHPAKHVPLTDLLPQLHALFETILAETRRNYSDAGVMRIYVMCLHGHLCCHGIYAHSPHLNEPLCGGCPLGFIRDRS